MRGEAKNYLSASPIRKLVFYYIKLGFRNTMSLKRSYMSRSFATHFYTSSDLDVFEEGSPH